MVHLKLILLCTEGPLTWNSQNLSDIHGSLPRCVNLHTPCPFGLYFFRQKVKYCTNWSLRFFPSLLFNGSLLCILLFSLSIPKHFLMLGTGKDCWFYRIFLSHLAQDKTDWEADGRCCLGTARTRAQGISSQAGAPCTVVQCAVERASLLTFQEFAIGIRRCGIRGFLGHLEIRNSMQSRSFVSSNCALTLSA